MRRLPLLLLLLLLPSFTAAQEQKGYDVQSYNAVVELNRLADSLSGHVSMSAVASRSLARILQHAKYLTIDSVSVNGIPAGLEWKDTAMGEYEVIAAGAISSGDHFTLVTFYHGKGTPEQLVSKNPWGGVSDYDTMMFAMGVGFAVPYTSCTRHWLPCYDLPDDKADTVDLTFIIPESEAVASNGDLFKRVSVGDGRSAWTWRTTKPIASYLLTFATGPYTINNIVSIDGPYAQLFALRRDSAAMAAHFRDRILFSLAYFDSLFGNFPFEKVGYVVTPIGSMEHQTMISLDKRALANTWSNTTPSHELAHQWWGDWVTCKTFDDAWLNEGFATYCQSLVLERFVGRTAYQNAQRSNRLAEVSSSGGRLQIDSLPIYGAASATHHTNNYPRTIYSKGAVVLGMLREYLGDEPFFRAIRSYGTHHAYSTATTSDLQQEFESASGTSLGWFFHQFIYTPGAPAATVRWQPASSGAELAITQYQDSLGYRFFGMPVIVEGIQGTQRARVNVWMDSTRTSDLFANFGFRPDSIVIDPDHLLLLQSNVVRKSAVGSSAPQQEQEELRVVPSVVTSGRIVIDAGSHEGGTATIYDSAGRVVQQIMILQFSKTRVPITMDVSSLAKGAYTVLLSERGEPRSGKFIIQ